MPSRVLMCRCNHLWPGPRIVFLLWLTLLFPAGLGALCGDASKFSQNRLIDADERCRLEAWALETGSSALVISVDGTIVFELSTPRSESPIHTMSVTKSVASLALGRMIQDGLLDSLDLKLSEIFPEWRQGRKAEITLRHLLTHSTGLQDLRNAGIEIEPAPDAVQLALAAELTEAPGETFRYNNKASNLLAAVVERLTDQKLDEYLSQSVFAELGITDSEWVRDAAGNPYGMAGLSLRARDLIKVGQLMNHRGEWDGQQLADKEFLTEALSPQREDNARVGLFWWLLEGQPSGYQANGWLGQWLVGLPGVDAVAVRLVDRADAKSTADPGEFLDVIRDVLASEAAPPDE